MKTPGWWPWQAKQRIFEEIDVPPVYLKLLRLTNVYDPYKKKAFWLFGVGVAVIIVLDIPGIFFTDPFTHVTKPEAAYLGIIGATAVGLMGLFSLGAYQYFKNNEVANWTFGNFTLRARRKLRIKFQAPIGTIERVDEKLMLQIRAVVDEKFKEKLAEFKQLAKVRGLDETKLVRNPSVLNGFYVPMPGCPLPDAFLLSPASEPSLLIDPLPGEYIWGGWIRQGKGDDFDLAVIDEYRFKLPGVEDVQVVPICVAAGTHYDFVHALERALIPPKLDSEVVETAKQMADARIVGIEAVRQLQVYKDAEVARENTQPVLTELTTDIAGNVLDILDLTNRTGQRLPGKRSRAGIVAGSVIVIAALGVVVWLVINGGRLW